jgi:hypothetical protein
MPCIPLISKSFVVRPPFLMAQAIKSYNPLAALVDLKFCAVTTRKQALSRRIDRGEQ